MLSRSTVKWRSHSQAGELEAQKPGEVRTRGCVPERSLTWKHKTRTSMAHLCAKFFYTSSEFIRVNMDLLFTTWSPPRDEGGHRSRGSGGEEGAGQPRGPGGQGASR